MNVLILPIEINNKLFCPISEYAVPGIRKGCYYISEDGEIFSKITNRFLHPTVSQSIDYYVIDLQLENGKSRTCLLHRIMMITFRLIVGYESLFVNHIDGNKLNCQLYNMEWSTLPENNWHAKEHGLLCVGEDCPWSVLTEQDVRDICFTIQNKQYSSITEIANKYNCSVTTIGDIVRGVTWKHVSVEYNLDYKIRGRFTPEEVHFMCNIFSLNKELSFNYLYYIIIFHLNLKDDRLLKRRIYKIYTKDPNNFYNITSQYNY